MLSSTSGLERTDEWLGILQTLTNIMQVPPYFKGVCTVFDKQLFIPGYSQVLLPHVGVGIPLYKVTNCVYFFYFQIGVPGIRATLVLIILNSLQV